MKFSKRLNVIPGGVFFKRLVLQNAQKGVIFRYDNGKKQPERCAQMKCPEIRPFRLMGEGKYLKLEELSFVDEKGRQRRWEAVSRAGGQGAVMVIAKTSRTDKVVLVRQFRPPAGKMMLEFPAGLIDPGESVEECAVREMKEETGYKIGGLEMLPEALSSPGMSGESIVTVLATIDEDDPANAAPKNSPEDSECSLSAVCVPEKELRAYIDDHLASGGGVDTKLLIYSLRS